MRSASGAIPCSGLWGPMRLMSYYLARYQDTNTRISRNEYKYILIQIHKKADKNKYDSRVILVNMEISVILGHEKTKIRNIIDYGKIDVFSVRTNIHIKNKMMGHLI